MLMDGWCASATVGAAIRAGHSVGEETKKSNENQTLLCKPRGSSDVANDMMSVDDDLVEALRSSNWSS